VEDLDTWPVTVIRRVMVAAEAVVMVAAEAVVVLEEVEVIDDATIIRSLGTSVVIALRAVVVTVIEL